MRVVLSKAVLKRNRACPAAYTSVEWNSAEDALIYEDWDQTVDRLFTTREGADQLEWLVLKKLVPMTKEEFDAAKTARGAHHG